MNTCEINLSISGTVVKQLDTVTLQKNIDSKSFTNEGNSYFQPKVTQVPVTKAGVKFEYGIVVIPIPTLNEQGRNKWKC